MRALHLAAAAALLVPAAGSAETTLIPEDWDYTASMRKVASRFTGKEGVVLHVGDSITYANGYSQWARNGKGKTPQDEAVCQWTHAGAKDDTDGWTLCSVDRPGGRSDTAAGGMRADEALAGGKAGLPSLADLLKKYNPRMVVLMLGTNDITAGRSASDTAADMAKAVDLILANGTIPILSTIPPYPSKEDASKAYNDALRDLGRSKRIPMIDYEKEILKRRPSDWNGTLLGRNNVHPSANQDAATPASEPTEDNLKCSGYLLRGWLSVRKIGEVKSRVVDSPLARDDKNLTPEEKAERAAAAKEEKHQHEETVKKALDEFRKSLAATKNPAERAEAVKKLGEAEKDPKIVAELAKHLSESFTVRTETIAALAKYRKDKAAAQALLGAIPANASDPSNLERLFLALGSVGHEMAAAVIAKHVPDREDRVSLAAIKALGEISAAASIDALIAEWERMEKEKKKGDEQKKAMEERQKLLGVPLKDSLQKLTGQKFTVMEDYRPWWNANRADFKPKEE
jgi:lysophospholipase L1-like esterase